jgi:hypothetical protein
MQLYYDIYDVKSGNFTSMSPEMRERYETDVAIFYETFTGKPVSADENGEPIIKRFDQIPLREFHKNDKCKPDGILRQNAEGSLNDNLFKKYAIHINKMMNKMNNNQDSLLKVLKEIFIFKKNKVSEKSENKTDDDEKKMDETEKKDTSAEKDIINETDITNETNETDNKIQGNIIIPNMIDTAPQAIAAAPQAIAQAIAAAPQAIAQAPAVPQAPQAQAIAAAQAPAQQPPAQAPQAQAIAQAPQAPQAPQAQAPPQAIAPQAAQAPQAIAPPQSSPQAPAAPLFVNNNQTNIQVGGINKNETETVSINPNLNNALLESYINSTRSLIVQLYNTCEIDFLEGISLFESIVATQLAKTTNFQIKYLNDLTTDYLIDHDI